MQKYKNFHDAVIESFNYDINNERVEVVLDALNFLEHNTNKRDKIKLTFIKVKELNVKEMFSWDFINEAVLEHEDDKRFIYFKTDKNSPAFSIICENLVSEII